MRKLKEPNSDVIYTFIYDNGITHAFRLLGCKPSGDFIMLNCGSSTGSHVTMSPKRFNYLYNKQLVSEVRTADLHKRMKALPPERIDHDTWIDNEDIPQMISFLGTIKCESDIRIAMESIGMEPKTLIEELEALDKYPKEGILNTGYGDRLSKSVSRYYKLKKLFG